MPVTSNKLAIAAAALLVLPAIAWAGAPEVISARQANFKKIGKATKSTFDELKKPDPSLAVIRANAQALEKLSLAVAGGFPRGSGPQAGIKTAALPAIWAKPADFRKANINFVVAARNLQLAAASGNMAKVGAAAGAMGGTCKGCHDQFKAKD